MALCDECRIITDLPRQTGRSVILFIVFDKCFSQTIEMLVQSIDCLLLFEFGEMGINRCDNEIVLPIENILAILSQQISKAEYWIIDRETLIALGECFNDLWDHCSLKRFDAKFEEFKRYLRDN